MHHPSLRTLPRQPPADLQQTTRITRHDRVHLRTLDRFDLLIQNRDRDLRILHRKRAAKTTTRLRILDLDKLSAAHVVKQAARLILDVQIAQPVTRVMPGQLSVPARADVFHLPHAHEKRTKLVRARRDRASAFAPLRIIREQLHEVMHHRRARSRRTDDRDRLARFVHRYSPTRYLSRLVAITGIERRPPTVRLSPVKIHFTTNSP